MSEPKNLDSVPLNSHAIPVLRKSQSWFLIGSMFLVSTLILAARVLYKPHSLERSLVSDQQWELVGSGQLKGPEDVAYHSRSKLIYTGCSDGWIKHVTVNKSAADTVVKNWVNTGGRPLGIAFGRHNDVIVADPVKGLLNITQRGEVKVLTVGNRDKKFKLIDSVVVAKNGMVYFTEASYKYSFDEYLLDILEGQPHGRLWSYNPTANKTRVLLTDLYFTNGMALSPDQDFLIFCETTKKRCRKYYIQGGKKGSVKNFTDLPGYPDNIRYAGEGKFLITLVLPSTGRPGETVLNNHFARKFLRMNTTEYIVQPHYEAANSTDVVFLVDTKGKVNARYVGPKMSLISSATRIGNYIYCGSPINMYMGRLNLQKYSSKLLATHCTDDDEPSLQ